MVPTTRRHLPYLFLLLPLLFSACDGDIQSQPLPTAVLPAAVPAVLGQDAAEPGDQTAAATPLPARPAAAVPLPTPTLDPDKDAWTILVYMSADNTMEPFALSALNAMEAAGKAKGVNLLVQLDRGGGAAAEGDYFGARRYLVRADSDLSQIGSEQLESLGEVNMGDPAMLSDFLVWGIQAFPANRYALIVWGPAGGWHGAAYDQSVGFPNEADLLTATDLGWALADSLENTGIGSLDLIAFDGGPMGQIEVMQAVQPYAEVMTAPSALSAGPGWDYTGLLSWLYQDPDREGSELSAQIAASASGLSAAVSGVALELLPDVGYALQQLADALAANIGLTAGAVSDARAASVMPALAAGFPNARVENIDLRQFAVFLAARGPDEAVNAWAEELLRSVDAALLPPGSDSDALRGIIQIYFPATAASYSPEYAQAAQLSGWDTLLTSYHQSAAVRSDPPVISITQMLSQSVGVQNPAFLDFEIAGFDTVDTRSLAGQYQEDGRLKLLWAQQLAPAVGRGSDDMRPASWRHGIYEGFLVWDSQASYLSDSDGNGGYAVSWPLAQDSSLVGVAGAYRPSGSEAYTEALLAFDGRGGRMAAMWLQNGQLTAPAVPAAGDEFRLHSFIYDTRGDIETVPGQSLFFGPEGSISIERRALPDGEYALGVDAGSAAGSTAGVFTDLDVENSGSPDGYAAYFDPYLGFQFLYPASWSPPSYQDAALASMSQDGTTQMRVTLFTDVGREVNAASLSQDAIDQFGPVQLLYTPETIAVADRQGQRTAYGYDRPGDEQRTGIFVSFVREDVGYLIDIDGPVEGEADTIAAIDTVVNSWQFRPASFGRAPGSWTVASLANFTVAQPSDFSYQQVNDWHRFSKDLDTFAAIRIQPRSRRIGQAMEALIRDAGSGVEALQVGEPFPYYLNSVLWTRADFSYLDAEAREVRGFLLVAEHAGQEVAAWAEGPADRYDSLQSAVFLMMISDLELSH